MNWITAFLVFLEGLLAFISPCILPLLPVYILYLSGEAASNPLPAVPASPSDTAAPSASAVLASNATAPNEAASTVATPTTSVGSPKPMKKRLFINTLFFVLGFTIVFMLLGATSTAIGQALAEHRQLLERVSGVIVIILGIHMAGWIRIPFLQSDHRFDFAKKSGSVVTSLLMGIAFSLGWTPCLGPFLGTALMLSSQSDTLLQGMALLFVFSMGLAVPFLLTSLLLNQLTSVFAWFRKHAGLIRLIGGLLLIVLGLLMLLGWFGYYARIFSLI